MRPWFSIRISNWALGLLVVIDKEVTLLSRCNIPTNCLSTITTALSRRSSMLNWAPESVPIFNQVLCCGCWLVGWGVGVDGGGVVSCCWCSYWLLVVVVDVWWCTCRGWIHSFGEALPCWEEKGIEWLKQRLLQGPNFGCRYGGGEESRNKEMDITASN